MSAGERKQLRGVVIVAIDGDLAERLYVLEAKDEIRRLMAAYVAARDLGIGSIDGCFTEDAVWEGVGRFADVLGRHVGREAIIERFSEPLPPGLHLLVNESISIDGDHGVGYWTYLQPLVLGGQAYWVAGRYHNDFHCQNGRWRFQHIRIEGIFQAPYDQGWAQVEFFRQ